MHKALESVQIFFDGMGTGFTTVVIQVVAALTFVEGLKSIGIIDWLNGLYDSSEWCWNRVDALFIVY